MLLTTMSTSEICSTSVFSTITDWRSIDHKFNATVAFGHILESKCPNKLKSLKVAQIKDEIDDDEDDGYDGVW